MDITLAITIAAGSSLVAAVLASIITWLICTNRAQRATQALTQRAIQAETQLETERKAQAEQIELLRAAQTAQQDTEQRLRDVFGNLSGDVLRQTNEQFLQLAQEHFTRHQENAHHNLSQLVEPLRDALNQQRESLSTIEQARQNSYGSIDALLNQMREEQQRLQAETANLVKALRQPQVRGRWGEIQLQRVVELAGMSEHCDFCQQQTSHDDDGARLRPDLQVRLPNQRQIVIDSKVPLMAFLEALEATDDQVRLARLKDHAQQVRRHVDEMVKRNYQKHIMGAHDFVVLFIPGEVFYSVALEHDSELLEYALGKGIILANPTTLIALLKAVALGWREAQLTEDAHKIKQAGEELYRRIRKLAEHFDMLGKNLTKSVKAYNETVGSLETQLLPSARRMHALQISNEAIAELQTIEQVTRPLTKPELIGAESAQQSY